MMLDTMRQMPPGPAHTLSLAEVRENGLQFVLENSRRYGSIFRYDLDGTAVTLVNHPDSIKHVLQRQHHNYIKKGSPDYLMHKHLLGEGLLTTEGEQWLRLRRMTEPAFHRRVIAQAGEMMVKTTQEMLSTWDANAHSNEPIDMVHAMSQLALTIVTKALFDYDISSEADSFSNAVQVLNEALGQNSITDPAAYSKMPAAIRTIQTMVAQIIAQRRILKSNPNDFLSLLLSAQADDTAVSLTNRQLRDQIITLLLAGHETTAKAMSWTLYVISQHPDIEQRLLTEIETVLAGNAATVKDLDKLPTMWNTIQEALRLYPPVWILSRIAVADDEIDGFHIPAGSSILVSPYAMHRHLDYWDEPERFNPDRFVDGVQRPFTYIPFGGGPRLCIGRQFATLEMQLVLITILQRFHVNMLPGHPVEPEGLVSLNPRYGLPMTLIPNRSR